MTRGDVTATADSPRCGATADIPHSRAKDTRGDGVGGSYAAPHTPR